MRPTFLFAILTPAPCASLAAQLDDLKHQLRDYADRHALTPAQLVATRVYLSDAANAADTLRQHALYRYFLCAGGVSIIEQPPLCGVKVALNVVFTTAAQVEKSGTPERMRIALPHCSLYLHSVRIPLRAAQPTKGEADSAEWQTTENFAQHEAWLAEDGLCVADHCLRTWLYVRDIDRNYAAAVRARNDHFAHIGLTPQTHYIASTGIEGCSEHAAGRVAADFLTVSGSGVGVGAFTYLHAPEYLNPTHEYGVAFERGTAVNITTDHGTERYLLLSGTASIDRHGQCVHRGDVLAQTERLFLNIEQLLKSGGADLSHLQYLIVYLRDAADYAPVAQYLAQRFPTLPHLITLARVCRPEWLIEVEGVAHMETTHPASCK